MNGQQGEPHAKSQDAKFNPKVHSRGLQKIAPATDNTKLEKGKSLIWN